MQNLRKQETEEFETRSFGRFEFGKFIIFAAVFFVICILGSISTCLPIIFITQNSPSLLSSETLMTSLVRREQAVTVSVIQLFAVVILVLGIGRQLSRLKRDNPKLTESTDREVLNLLYEIRSREWGLDYTSRKLTQNEETPLSTVLSAPKFWNSLIEELKLVPSPSGMNIESYKRLALKSKKQSLSLLTEDIETALCNMSSRNKFDHKEQFCEMLEALHNQNHLTSTQKELYSEIYKANLRSKPVDLDAVLILACAELFLCEYAGWIWTFRSKGFEDGAASMRVFEEKSEPVSELTVDFDSESRDKNAELPLLIIKNTPVFNFIGLDNIPRQFSPNCSSRNGTRIKNIVIQAMSGSYEETIAWHLLSRSKRSSHFYIGKGGQIFQLVECTDAAWHTTGSNDFTIAVAHEDVTYRTTGRSSREIILDYSNDPNWVTEEMRRSSVQLISALCRKYNILETNIIGHNDPVLGPRDIEFNDPGPFWNMESFRHLIGQSLS